MPGSQVRRLYVRFARPHIGSPLAQQRLKMLWDCWGYRVWMGVGLPLRARVALLLHFIRIDLTVLHGHKPEEISHVLKAIIEAPPGDVVEAGCWRGGSTAKFSLAADRAGRRLHVFDTFSGVPEELCLAPESQFAGDYAADMESVRDVIASTGVSRDVTLHKGRFDETLSCGALVSPVAVAYIDCDIVRGYPGRSRRHTAVRGRGREDLHPGLPSRARARVAGFESGWIAQPLVRNLALLSRKGPTRSPARPASPPPAVAHPAIHVPSRSAS